MRPVDSACGRTFVTAVVTPSARLTPLLLVGALAAFGLDFAPIAGYSWEVPHSVFAVLLLGAAYACRRARPATPLAAPAAEAPLETEQRAAPLPIAMATIDREHRCIDASPALAAWLGSQCADLGGLQVDDMF